MHELPSYFPDSDPEIWPNLDPDPEFGPNLDPDPGLQYVSNFEKKLKIINKN